MSKLNNLIKSDEKEKVFDIVKTKVKKHKEITNVMKRIAKNAEYTILKNSPDAEIKTYFSEPDIKICNNLTYDFVSPSAVRSDDISSIEINCCDSDCRLRTSIYYGDDKKGQELGAKVSTIYQWDAFVEATVACDIDEHIYPEGTNFHATCVAPIEKLELMQRKLHKILR